MANDIVYQFDGSGGGMGLGDIGSSGWARPIGFYGGQIVVNPTPFPVATKQVSTNPGIPLVPPAPTPIPVQYTFSFDTIGQTIVRTIGHCRLPMRLIWAQGINQSGDSVTSTTISFAAALCSPIDPTEQGTISGILIGSTALFDGTSPVIPEAATQLEADLLSNSLNNAIIYPGDEEQEPCPLIVADKGSDVTNAFRGIRYIVLENWPLTVGGLSLSPSNLSAEWTRTNTISNPHTPTYTSAAVEFLSGST